MQLKYGLKENLEFAFIRKKQFQISYLSFHLRKQKEKNKLNLNQVEIKTQEIKTETNKIKIKKNNSEHQ